MCTKVNLYLLATGLHQGWSEMERLYYRDGFDMLSISPLTMLVFGSFLGTILSGFVTIKFGRKMPLSYVLIFIIVSDNLTC